MDNILNFPTSTHVDRLVPKTAFYKHLEINTRLRRDLWKMWNAYNGSIS